MRGQNANQGLVIRLTAAASVYDYRQVLLFRSRITPLWVKRTQAALPALRGLFVARRVC